MLKRLANALLQVSILLTLPVSSFVKFLCMCAKQILVLGIIAWAANYYCGLLFDHKVFYNNTPETKVVYKGQLYNIIEINRSTYSIVLSRSLNDPLKISVPIFSEELKHASCYQCHTDTEEARQNFRLAYMPKELIDGLEKIEKENKTNGK